MSSRAPSSTDSPENSDFIKNGRIVRPPNAFMIYLSYFCKCNKDVGGGAKLAAVMWEHAAPDQRAHYKALADSAAARHKALYPGWKHIDAKKVAAKAAEKAKREEKKRSDTTSRKPPSRQAKARSNAYHAHSVASSSIDTQTYVPDPNMHFDRQVSIDHNNAPEDWNSVAPETYHAALDYPVQQNLQAGNWDHLLASGMSYNDQVPVMFNATGIDPALFPNASNAFTAHQQLQPQQMSVASIVQSPERSSYYYPPHYSPYAFGPGYPMASSEGLRAMTPSEPLAAPFYQPGHVVGPSFVHPHRVATDSFGYTNQSSFFAPAPRPAPLSAVTAYPTIDPASSNDSWLNLEYEQMAASAYATPSDEPGPSSIGFMPRADLHLAHLF